MNHRHKQHKAGITLVHDWYVAGIWLLQGWYNAGISWWCARISLEWLLITSNSHIPAFLPGGHSPGKSYYITKHSRRERCGLRSSRGPHNLCNARSSPEQQALDMVRKQWSTQLKSYLSGLTIVIISRQVGCPTGPKHWWNMLGIVIEADLEQHAGSHGERKTITKSRQTLFQHASTQTFALRQTNLERAPSNLL